MIGVLPLLITACISFHCKLSRQSTYFKRLVKENYLLRQTVYVQVFFHWSSKI